MKFHKGQKVVCISKKSDWDYTIPNLDEYLKMALGVKRLPSEGEVCIVTEPMTLHYQGKCYIKIEGYDQNIFTESGFEPISKIDNRENNLNIAKRGLKIKTKV